MELRENEEVVREWNWEHEVIIAREEDGLEWLICECVSDPESDYDECDYYQRARSQLQEEAKEQFSDKWNEIGLKDSIIDIFEKINDGKHLGQVESGIIYVQEVARLLEVEWETIYEAVQDLFREERLDLNGMILKEFVGRFRFPQEIQNLFRYMIEEPLGWPNGDAGMLTIRELEDTIDEETRFDSGDDVFWEHNYPNIASNIRVMFGIGWLLGGLIDMLESDDLDKQKLRWDALEEKLERALNIVRNIKD